ncbi:ankyrin repeat domain-containing protein [Chitinimonas sp.]|uniref:ankyrin repeat domain-containing protein n=1 Tax=Chitinimonas sp. TaxID=1934313 RepID=UPI002F9342BB
MHLDFEDDTADIRLPHRRARLDGIAGDPDGNVSRLHRAVLDGEYALLPVLLRVCSNLDATNADGDTALHLAARVGSKISYRLLLQAGANAEARNAHGETPDDIMNIEH